MSSKYVYFTEDTHVGETPPAGDYDLWVNTSPLSSTTFTEKLSDSQKLSLFDDLSLAQKLSDLGIKTSSKLIKEYLLDWENNIFLLFGNLTTSTLTTSSNSFGETAILT